MLCLTTFIVTFCSDKIKSRGKNRKMITVKLDILNVLWRGSSFNTQFVPFLTFLSCPRDSTLKYIYKKSSTQKFTFKAFKFRNVSSLRMHVHCDVVTCRSSDTGSVCDKGCAERKRLRRENKPYIMDKDVFLSLGPVNFEEETAGWFTYDCIII